MARYEVAFIDADEALHIAEILSDEEVGKLFTAILHWQTTGEPPRMPRRVKEAFYVLVGGIEEDTNRITTIIKEKEAKSKDRRTLEYREWRKSVYERDGYVCQICGRRGGRLNAHHIKPFATHPKLRTEVANGITLCEACHRMVHHG